mmetsp:Transcript_47737/g.119281  ORF Transcript_47737/g.119281 Transcript_47737/m.119281 type:complete len:255 (-) Transcript_47737:54-818(-)
MFLLLSLSTISTVSYTATACWCPSSTPPSASSTSQGSHCRAMHTSSWCTKCCATVCAVAVGHRAQGWATSITLVLPPLSRSNAALPIGLLAQATTAPLTLYSCPLPSPAVPGGTHGARVSIESVLTVPSLTPRMRNCPSFVAVMLTTCWPLGTEMSTFKSCVQSTTFGSSGPLLGFLGTSLFLSTLHPVPPGGQLRRSVYKKSLRNTSNSIKARRGGVQAPAERGVRRMSDLSCILVWGVEVTLRGAPPTAALW